MTQEQLREIDLLIAEKVMHLNTKSFMDHTDFDTSKELVYMGPRYSTDISAAWEVVEKLRSNGIRKEISIYISDTKPVCMMHNGFIQDWGPKPKDSIRVEAETAPLAICTAALKSVGVEV